MRHLSSALAIASLLLVACRMPAATNGINVRTGVALDPVPYSTPDTPPTVPAPQPESQPLSDAEVLQWGAAIYNAQCAPCHQSNGEGNLAIFPALNRNAFVTLRAPEPVIDTVLHGREIMPAFAPTLNDQEVAAVLSYIRNAWDNRATFVNTEQVEAVRAANQE